MSAFDDQYEPLDDALARDRSHHGANGDRKPWDPANPHFRAPKLDLAYPAQLEGDPPARRWIVQDFVPVGHVTLLSGHGGIGKSILAMQLLTACATGNRWIGRATAQCPAVGMFCEDSRSELWRRQVGINRHYGIDFDGLQDLVWIPRRGDDNTLATLDRDSWTLVPTPIFQSVHNVTQDTGARLLVIDARHDVFAGLENDRIQARRFIQLLSALASDMDGAVLLIDHPSLEGLRSGSGMSGSTSWHNAVRARLFVTRLKDDDGEESRDELVLSTRKANYAAIADDIVLHWDDGAFVPETPPAGIVASIERVNVEKAFLEGLETLERQGVNASPSPHARNFVARLIAETPIGKRHGKRALASAMHDLFQRGVIASENYGRKGDERRNRVVIVQPAEGDQQHRAAKSDDDMPF